MDKKIVAIAGISLLILLLVSVVAAAVIVASSSIPALNDGKQLYKVECSATICEGAWGGEVRIDQFSCDRYEAGWFSMQPLAFWGFGSKEGTLRLYDTTELMGKKNYDTGGWFSLCEDYTVSGKTYEDTVYLKLYDEEDNIIESKTRTFGG